jgi:hypothetical protein
MANLADTTVEAALAPLAEQRGALAVRRILILLGCMVYALGLREAYVDHVAPILHYQGEVDLFPPLSTSIFATLAAVLPAAFLPQSSRYPGLMIGWLAYLLIFVPSCIIPFHAVDYESNGYVVFAAFLGLNAIGLAWLSARRINLEAGRLRFRTETAYLAVIGVLALVVQVYVWSVLGIQTSIGDSIEEIYDFREAIFDRIWIERLIFTGYLLQFQSNAILPVLTAVALVRRRWLLLGATFVGQYLLYLIMAQKSPVAVFALQVVLFAIIGRGENAALRIIMTLAGAVWFVLWLDDTYDLPGLVFSTVRRAATTNGLLTGYYYDYFVEGNYAYFSQTILAGFSGATDTTSSYKITIGSTYAWPGASANANFWADGFANLGWAGVVIMTVVLGFVLILLNSIVSEGQTRLVIVAMGGVIQVLANTGLQTTLVSGGMLLALFLIYLMPPERPAEPAPVPAR